MNAILDKSVTFSSGVEFSYYPQNNQLLQISSNHSNSHSGGFIINGKFQSNSENPSECPLITTNSSYETKQFSKSTNSDSSSLMNVPEVTENVTEIPDSEVSEPPFLIDEPADVNPIHEMIAGSVAACVTRFCIAPLDVIKIRFQIQETSHCPHYSSLLQAVKKIMTEEGWRAFWKGNLAAELMVVPYGAVSFLAYQKCRHALERNVLRRYPLTANAIQNHSSSLASISPFHHHLVNISSGSFAGFCATVATYPLDLMRTRFAAQQEPKLYHSLASAFVHVIQSEGIRGLYLGMWPTLCGIVPLMAIQFGCYEGLKLFVERTHTRREEENERKQNKINIQKLIEQQTIHSQALSMGETSTNSSHSNTPVNSHSSIKFWEQSLCGFTAGVVSKFVTMPFDVIKKRFQVSGFAWDATKRIHVESTNTNSASVASSAPANPFPFNAQTANLNPQHPSHMAHTVSSHIAKGAASPFIDSASINACPLQHSPNESTQSRKHGSHYSHHHHHHQASHPNAATSTLASTSTPIGLLKSPTMIGSHMTTPNAASIQPPGPSIKPPPSAAATPPPSSINDRHPGPNSHLPHQSSMPAGFRSMFTSTTPRAVPITFAAGHRPFTGVIDCARGIIRHEGWLGLFKGTVPSTLKAGPNSALIYVFYEQTMNALQTLDKSRKAKIQKSHH